MPETEDVKMTPYTLIFVYECIGLLEIMLCVLFMSVIIFERLSQATVFLPLLETAEKRISQSTIIQHISAGHGIYKVYSLDRHLLASITWNAKRRKLS